MLPAFSSLFLPYLIPLERTLQTFPEVCPLSHSKSNHLDNKNQPSQVFPGQLDTRVYHFKAIDFIPSPQTSTVMS